MAHLMSHAELDLDLVRAHGVALALIGKLLEGAGSIPSGEFSRLLGLLAVVTSETEVRQGDILAVWASMARSVDLA